MFVRLVRRALVAAVTLDGCFGGAGRPGHKGYEAIFDGTPESLRGWVQAPSGSFKLQPDGSLLSQGGLGMLWYGAKEYGNFSLKLQFRDVLAGRRPAPTAVCSSGSRTRASRSTQRPPGSCGTVGSARDVAGLGGHLLRTRDPDLRR